MLSLISRLFCLVSLALLAACAYVTPSVHEQSEWREWIDGDQSLPKPYRMITIDGKNRAAWMLHVTPPDTPHPVEPEGVYDYVLGPGDVMTLTLYVIDSEGEETLKRIIPAGASLQSENEFLVTADGTVTIPFAGKLKVAGKPFQQVRDMIETRMRDYFVAPQMEARISQFANGEIVVSGEVANPTMLDMSHEAMQVMEAIEAAGGLLPTADLYGAKLTRADGHMLPVDLRALIHEGDRSQNYQLAAGDRLHIPRNHANKLFVMGEVLEPQSMQMHPQGASLTEILSEVSGVEPTTGDASHIYVLRDYPIEAASAADEDTVLTSQVTIFHLDASNVANWVYADDFVLLPRDVVYVGAQPITSWNRFITQLLPQSVSTLINRNNYTK